MATTYDFGSISVPAGSDLSTKQFYLVKVNSSGQLALAGVSEKPAGVLLNKPNAAGQMGTVQVCGVSKVVAGGTVTAGQEVGPNASGQAVAATAWDSPTIGTALESATSGQTFEVLMTHSGYDRQEARVYADWSSIGAAKGLANFQIDGTAFDGTADVVNIIHTQAARLGCVAIVGQTLVPVMDANGLNIGMDQTDNDGAEVFQGILGTSGRPFIIGDDPAFYFKCKFQIEDVSGTDDFHVGFRRAEPVNGTFDNYLDLASIGIVTSANPALIQLETILNNGATTTTSTTDTLADATEVTFGIYVSAAGVVTYTIDGSAPTATAAFTFDDGDPVIPFVHYLQSSDLTGAISIAEWDVGFQ